MIPIGHWRRLYDEGLCRRPRLGPATPADIAALWLRLSERQRDNVTAAALEQGVTIEMAIRLRIAHVQRMFAVPAGHA